MSSADPSLLEGHVAPSSIFTDTESLRAASLDNARLAFKPEAVVKPADETELSNLLRIANREGVAITPRGAGSGTTGAASPVRGGWVLDLSEWNEFSIEASAGIAHAQAGVICSDLQTAAEAQGWFYPPDPSSAKYATIGGNLATNAGGLRGAKYGVTRDYVLGLEGFLASGEKVRWGAPLRKFASGLNVRDLWIGSEGLLGIITKASLKLVPKPASTLSLLAAFPDEDRALRAVEHILGERLVPCILEFLDRQSVTCAQRRRGRVFFDRIDTPALLLVEIDGAPSAVAADAEKLEHLLHKTAQNVVRAETPADRESLWEARRTCSQAMFELGNTKLNEDIVVPLSAYRELLRFTLELKEMVALATPTFGHAADGNFHVHIMYNADDSEQTASAERGLRLLFEKVVALGGAITGEHGIGLAKSPFLSLQHSAAEIAVMERIKQALDPNGILNPGKMFTPFEMWQHRRDRDFIFPWDKRH